MKQIELTSKLVVALIAIVVVFSAMTVPVAAQSSAPPIRANSVTSESIKDGEVKTQDLANGAVTSAKIADGTIEEEDIADGVIPSGAVQPTIHSVTGERAVIETGEFARVTATCPDGELATGGGFAAGADIKVSESNPTDLPNPQSWVAGGTNTGPFLNSFSATVVCMDFSP